MLRTQVASMSRKDALAFFAARLLEHCRTEDPRLNYIRVVQRKADGGVALYCVHDFYSRYSFSAGSRGPAMTRFIDHWHTELRQHQVTRVGVWSADAEDNGVWFEIR